MLFKRNMNVIVVLTTQLILAFFLPQNLNYLFVTHLIGRVLLLSLSKKHSNVLKPLAFDWNTNFNAN